MKTYLYGGILLIWLVSLWLYGGQRFQSGKDECYRQHAEAVEALQGQLKTARDEGKQRLSDAAKVLQAQEQEYEKRLKTALRGSDETVQKCPVHVTRCCRGCGVSCAPKHHQQWQ